MDNKIFPPCYPTIKRKLFSKKNKKNTCRALAHKVTTGQVYGKTPGHCAVALKDVSPFGVSIMSASENRHTLYMGSTYL